MTEFDNQKDRRETAESETRRDAKPLAKPIVQDTASTIGGWMIAMLWLIAIGAGTFMAQQWLDERMQSREAKLITNSNGSQALVLTADRLGQYLVQGEANGDPVAFLLDTGASGISIPQRTADRLGLQRGKPARVMTANGDITVYATTLEHLSIGPFSRRNVEAHINPQMGGEMALLGMSFLRHYELVQRQGELSITLP